MRLFKALSTWFVASAVTGCVILAVGLPAAADPPQVLSRPGQAAASEWNEALDRTWADDLNVHSVLVMQDGDLVLERYRAGRDRGLYSLWSSCRHFGPEDLHDMRSVSKSVIGLLYGVLLERHEVPELTASVTALYPDHSELDRPPRNAIRIRDLLTMSAGLAWDEPSPVHRARDDDQTALVWTGDLYPTVFGREVVARPGDKFVYSGGLTSVLVDLMERSTGRPLKELVEKELFEPLGIRAWTWSRDLRGRPLAFAGLRLRPLDLMKLGELVLHHGRWQGKQLVPRSWVEAATAVQVMASSDQGYGYQWWVRMDTSTGRNVRVIQAIGNGGQRLYVVPELDMVVAMTGGDYGSPEILAAEDRVFEGLLAFAAGQDQREDRLR